MKIKYSTMHILLIVLLSKHLGHADFKDSMESLNRSKIDLAGFYMGLGGGQGFGGGLYGWSGKFILSNHWGFTMNKHKNIRKTQDLPADFNNNLYKRFDPPKEYLDIFSLNLIRHIQTKNKKLRWGCEVGTSILKERSPIFKPNLNYLPSLHGISNYITSYAVEKGWGLNGKITLEFPIATFLGAGLSATTQLNKFRSTFGYDLYFNFGLVRKKQQPPEI